MGAGVVRQQRPDGTFVYTSGPAGTNFSGPSVVISSRPVSPEMVCESCNSSFNIFNRKKLCQDCDRYFCNNCIVRLPEDTRKKKKQCNKCNILTTGNFTRQELQKWKVKDLRPVLNKRNISTDTCTEKHDLIDLIVVTFGNVRNPSSSYTSNVHSGQDHSQARDSSNQTSSSSTNQQNSNGQTRTSQTSFTTYVHGYKCHVQLPTYKDMSEQQQSNSQQQHSSSQTETPETEAQRAERLRRRQEQEMRAAQERMRAERQQEQEEVVQERVKRYAITDVQSEEEIENLTVRQLKEILVNNFVDYKGCVEKAELQERVKRLWREKKNNDQKAKEIIEGNGNPNPKSQTSTSGSTNEDDLCKICMDATIDCVLLECGHMVTCTTCGRRLAECPICRQYVVRVVHTFKS